MAEPSSVPVPPPPVTHVLETCLMVKDIKASTEFYKTTFNLDPFMDTVSVILTPA
jgi:predicted lactoylglutathione lyase